MASFLFHAVLLLIGACFISWVSTDHLRRPPNPKDHKEHLLRLDKRPGHLQRLEHHHRGPFRHPRPQHPRNFELLVSRLPGPSLRLRPRLATSVDPRQGRNIEKAVDTGDRTSDLRPDAPRGHRRGGEYSDEIRKREKGFEVEANRKNENELEMKKIRKYEKLPDLEKSFDVKKKIHRKIKKYPGSENKFKKRKDDFDFSKETARRKEKEFGKTEKNIRKRDKGFGGESDEVRTTSDRRRTRSENLELKDHLGSREEASGYAKKLTKTKSLRRFDHEPTRPPIHSGHKGPVPDRVSALPESRQPPTTPPPPLPRRLTYVIGDSGRQRFGDFPALRLRQDELRRRMQQHSMGRAMWARPGRPAWPAPPQSMWAWSGDDVFASELDRKWPKMALSEDMARNLTQEVKADEENDNDEDEDDDDEDENDFEDDENDADDRPEDDAAFSFSPKKQHLKRRKLLRQMSDDFDAAWMAAATPTGAEPAPALSKPKGREKFWRQSGAEKLTASLRKKLREEGFNPEKKESHLILRVFESWFSTSFGECPVSYEWTKLSDIYWPRWVRKGTCSSSSSSFSSPLSPSSRLYRRDESYSPLSFALPHPQSQQLQQESPHLAWARELESSCSWPPGMRCRPSREKKTLKILRWHCQRRLARRKSASAAPGTFRRRTKMRCRWVKVPYLVTDDCECGL